MNTQLPSPMERLIYSLCIENYELRKRRLIPSIQVQIGKYYADFLFDEIKAVLEYDGREFHNDILRDVERDIFFKQQGYETYRISKPYLSYRLEHEGELIAEHRDLQELLITFARLYKEYMPKPTSEFVIYTPKYQTFEAAKLAGVI
jgi:very-short-patch-repair endonuclease